MINLMNARRTHKDSARFGTTEYSDMSHDEFLATKLNVDLMKPTSDRRINSIIKERSDTSSSSASYNIIRYTRDTTADMDGLPMKIDWFVKRHSFKDANKRLSILLYL